MRQTLQNKNISGSGMMIKALKVFLVLLFLNSFILLLLLLNNPNWLFTFRPNLFFASTLNFSQVIAPAPVVTGATSSGGGSFIFPPATSLNSNAAGAASSAISSSNQNLHVAENNNNNSGSILNQNASPAPVLPVQNSNTNAAVFSSTGSTTGSNEVVVQPSGESLDSTLALSNQPAPADLGPAPVANSRFPSADQPLVLFFFYTEITLIGVTLLTNLVVLSKALISKIHPGTRK